MSSSNDRRWPRCSRNGSIESTPRRIAALVATENEFRRGTGVADTESGASSADPSSTNPDAEPRAAVASEPLPRDLEALPSPNPNANTGSTVGIPLGGSPDYGPDQPLPRVLEGRWQLEREIGAGGMGRVFEARHLTLGNRVAVKLLHAQRLGAPEAVHRFLREARLAGVATHPGIARVFDFDITTDGAPYMVMELLAGTTLEARMQGPDRISLVDGIDVLLDVLDTLAAIHAAGVVHRDIKPGNIFVMADPSPVRAKLLDFGLARGIDPLGTDANLTRTGQVLGTPHYMSPEQARGQTMVGPDADLWAMGVILYGLATGRRPFPGENYNETLANILTRDPPSVRSIAPSLPPLLESVLRRCFARDPGKRYRTAEDLSRALKALKPELARIPPADQGRPRRPWPWRWLAVAAVGVAAVASGGIWFFGSSPPPSGEPLRLTWSPYRDRAFLAESTRWLLDDMGERLGREVSFAPASSYDDAVAQLVRGKVDAAGLSPTSYVQARQREPDLILLARVRSNGADTYQSILFTRSGSALRQLGDVRGQSICFVDPSSTSGFVYPRVMLRRAGVDPDRELGPVVFAGNHQRVVSLLTSGDCEVAGSSSTAITQWAEEAGISPATFRILAASDPIPGDALVARAGLSPELLTRLRAAVAALVADTAAGRFADDREVSGLVSARDSDYDVIRVLLNPR
jgi:eukaryotic-like serine/threonine-protein kinase